jgi:hypothetical protein
VDAIPLKTASAELKSRLTIGRWNGILRGDRETGQYETGGKAILDRIEADQSPYRRVRESRHLS